MNRRQFYCSSGILGVVGTLSANPILASAYESISTSLILQEFDDDLKKAFDKFNSDIIWSSEMQNVDSKKCLAGLQPVSIINKRNTNKIQSITYKNKAGNFISIQISDNKTRIELRDNLKDIS